ncbi:response regulator [Roseateles cavernae]|uniref:response regulator n=1 Tax=Roseateles cavernae TaxID=3153578 RepID=UPI0032E40B97
MQGHRGASAARLAGIVALVVDDFSTMRRIISALLKDLGCERVIEAEDGIEALRVLENQTVHLIVSDWSMPRMTGIELLTSIRTHARLGTLPFLMVSAEGSRENIVQAARGGADGYIVKPFTSAVLGDKVELVLRKRAAAAADAPVPAAA